MPCCYITVRTQIRDLSLATRAADGTPSARRTSPFGSPEDFS
jgi:hypothetical protein